MILESGSPAKGEPGASGYVLQKLAQARAGRVIHQHLRIAIFRNAPFIDKDQAGSHFFGEADFVGYYD